MLLGALSFLFVILFIPGMAGAATAPRWAFLSLVVPVVLLFVRAGALTAASLCGLGFVAYYFVSTLWAPVFVEAIGVLWKVWLLAGLFIIGSRLKDLKPVFIGAGLALTINSAITVAEWNRWIAWPFVTDFGGLFLNRNFSAEAAGLVLVGAIGYRLWWLVPGLLPSVYMPFSRGVFFALAVTAAAAIWARSQVVAILLVAALVFSGLYVGLSRQDTPAVAQRVSIWVDTVRGSDFWGHGPGSFYALFPKVSTTGMALTQRPEHAHNDTMELVFETGAASLLFFAMLFCLLHGAWRVEHYVLVAFLAMGVTSFPLQMPVTAALFGLVAGHLSRFGPALRAPQYLGRGTLRAWLVGQASPRRGP